MKFTIPQKIVGPIEMNIKSAVHCRSLHVACNVKAMSCNG